MYPELWEGAGGQHWPKRNSICWAAVLDIFLAAAVLRSYFPYRSKMQRVLGCGHSVPQPLEPAADTFFGVCVPLASMHTASVNPGTPSQLSNLPSTHTHIPSCPSLSPAEQKQGTCKRDKGHLFNPEQGVIWPLKELRGLCCLSARGQEGRCGTKSQGASRVNSR